MSRDANADGAERVILLVDDAAECVSAMEIALCSMARTSVRSAGNGAAAWQYLERCGADTVCAVVTDLEMPLMDGFELIQRIRSSTVHAKVPVIVVSGTTEPAAQRRALEAGANAFFGKPCSAGRVRAVVEQLLHENNGSGA